MANTLKFGAGQWATKEGSTLAYNDENDNYKPLPFTFTRASNATVVNKAGLIETVGNGIPRIDYKDDSEGALLLEPQRTNSITYSEDFSDASWIKSNLTVNSVSENNPLGNKCYKIIGDNNNNLKLLYKNNILTSDATFSVLVKASGYNFALIKGGGGAYRVIFDLVNGTVGNKDTDDGIYSIEDYGNGWYRCSAKFNNMPTNYASVTASATNSIFDKTGNGVDGILLAYTQAEIGSYATSYIPTQGSSVTRLADSCSQTPPSGIIGQTEGTILVDFNFDGDISGNRSVAILSSGGSADFIASFIFNNLFYARIRANNGSLIDVTKSNLTSGNHKVAIAYASNDLTFYLDGNIVGQNTSASVSFGSELSTIKIGESTGGTAELGGLVSKTLLYNTRLSNSELAALTQV